ncbi:MAG: NADH-quinone oxidoreductase subunit L [Acidobacteria bacterium]|nr:NADH-quinone oxidoreductase subunit L [Acidobacteriota bacterium]
MLEHLGWIPLVPFIGFLLNGLFGRRAGKSFVSIVAVGAAVVSAILGTIAAIGYAQTYHHGEPHIDVAWTWLASGIIEADIAFQLDPLSIVMLMVVTWIGSLIHLYSVGYMAHDDGYHRYFAYLNLFLAAMLVLVLASNYLFAFVGWEGVGLCSYLLIGFYLDKEWAAAAGKKAFIVNRIGDFGFLVAMFLMFQYAGTVDYQGVADAALTGGIPAAIITGICLLLLLGATGKSAQIPLYVWLPDAMAGPTPVSALIHAATMVTAGVYMVVRSNVLFRMSPEAMATVALVGAATGIVAATIALAQYDIKKVLAYSTVSQLGFMFMAAGVGAFVAAIFHLVTHAFFKACLFLGSGSVIHGMGGEQDLRQMGGLKHHMPITRITFLVSTYAIAGLPLAAGFVSKDEILASAWVTPWFAMTGKIVWILGTIAAFLTAFYMYRLYYLTFEGEFRGTEAQHHHVHESPWTMTVPLVVLAVLSAIGGLILGFPPLFGHMLHIPHLLDRWLHPIFTEAPGLPEGIFTIPASGEAMVMIVSTALALLGWWLARSFFRDRQLSGDARLRASRPGLATMLENKYYVDEMYDKLVVRPLHSISVFSWKIIDAIIDGTISLGAYIVGALGDLMRFLQTGNVRNYALALLLGMIFFTWMAS